MKVTDEQINSIVNRVVDRLVAGTGVEEGASGMPEASIPPSQPKAPLRKPVPVAAETPAGSFRGAFTDIESAIAAAERAYREYKDVPKATRKKIITAIREICRENLETLSRMGVEETTYGRYEDKLVKNALAIEKTPGLEDLEPATFTGDEGLTLLELAPFGVIGGITPCTNPTETIICNGIGMIAGGNSVVFNPHPAAKKTSVFLIDLMNRAVISEGGPPNLLATVINPTIQSAQELMKHPKIGLLVVTGGPAVVAAAMKSGKRVVGAGPGNPPVVVDETADMEQAARDIVMSASSDNNIICTVEKEIIVTRAAADRLKKALLGNGAVELSGYQARRLEGIIVENGEPNKKWIGKDVQVILKQIGMDVDPSKRLAITETGPDHPFARLELLMPVLPFIRVKDIDEAIDIAYELEGGCFHTASIHSKNIDNMHRMAVRMNTSIFVKNGPALAGLGLNGEGPASFTIASPTGEGVTTARHFTRIRRCVIHGHFGIV